LRHYRLDNRQQLFRPKPDWRINRQVNRAIHRWVHHGATSKPHRTTQPSGRSQQETNHPAFFAVRQGFRESPGQTGWIRGARVRWFGSLNQSVNQPNLAHRLRQG